MQRPALLWYAALMLVVFLRPAGGEVFQLRNGGRIEGDLVNADENPRTSYVIALPGGGQVTLDAAVVEPVPPGLAEYEKVRRQSPDTVQGNLQMSDWCRDHRLNAQRKTHMERVLQLDPDQADARRFLGYRKYKDKWMTLEEQMADQGKVKRIVNGNTVWITQQEAELHESREKQRAAEIEWVKKITKWRKWLDGNRADLVADGEKKIRAIDDPMAITGLAERLVKKIDTRTDVRLMYVEALGHINAREAQPGSTSHEARGPLCTCAIDDPVEEVRLCCLDELAKQKDARVTAYFEGRMRDKNTSNAVINRAGVALGRIKDPSSIETLIQYLVTRHKEVLPPAGGPGSMTSTFNKNGGGGGGLGMNQKPTIVFHDLQNPDVLGALVAIVGQNYFSYDQRAWITWYRNQKAAGASVEAKKQ